MKSRNSLSMAIHFLGNDYKRRRNWQIENQPETRQ